TAEGLIREAGDRDLPVSLVFTADNAFDAAFKQADDALKMLAAAKPMPLPAARDRVIPALQGAFADEKPGTLAFITDGIQSPKDQSFVDALKALTPGEVQLIGHDNSDAVTITNAVNSSERLTIDAARLDPSTAQVVNVSARDMQGRIVGTAALEFKAGDRTAEGTIEAPFELRNDYARLTIDGFDTAGAVHLLDDSFKRRSV